MNNIAKPNNAPQINEAIRFKEVRLIDAGGNMRGIVSIEEANRLAEEANLDLVLINASADNPVCRILDYGKFVFEQQKREKEAKKNQKVMEVKEIGLKLTTEEHDLGYKMKNVSKFLADGNRVKISIRFRGREMAYTNQGFEVMKKVADMLSDIAQIDKQPKVEGRNMIMFLNPKKKQ